VRLPDYIEIPLEKITLPRIDLSNAALMLAIFLVIVDPPQWAGPHVMWAWKGIAGVAAYYKGLHTEKPKSRREAGQ